VGGIAGIALIVISLFFAFRWGHKKGAQRDPGMEVGESGQVISAEAEQTGVVR